MIAESRGKENSPITYSPLFTKRMMGHSFANDITNGVYGHRTLEELRTEIEKIKVLEKVDDGAER